MKTMVDGNGKNLVRDGGTSRESVENSMMARSSLAQTPNAVSPELQCKQHIQLDRDSSLRRDHLSPKHPIQSRLSYNVSNTSNMIATSRLGETVSSERDPGSLKPTKLLTWTRFRTQNNPGFLATSLRRVSLA
ncbi:hypothetical protein DEO72_LG11g2087 [Vigna unguiculata]|uniref:Uncharacterized protein n=1 Tax=Vigna unguiculata TaxID=3917 RepID=A0A4D6NRF9_VIGUN|nr:hypothetical protein DEO72_LG11g2087 [Vigna unguiculata]